MGFYYGMFWISSLSHSLNLNTVIRLLGVSAGESEAGGFPNRNVLFPGVVLDPKQCILSPIF